jgi:hypothetical protein
MLLGTPIQFTLYGDDDEIKGIYRRSRLPVMYAERAIELSSALSGESMTKDQLLILHQLIVEYFGGQFTVEDLQKGAILNELLTVLKAITTRAIELMPVRTNPTLPGK